MLFQRSQDVYGKGAAEENQEGEGSHCHSDTHSWMDCQEKLQRHPQCCSQHPTKYVELLYFTNLTLKCDYLVFRGVITERKLLEEKQAQEDAAVLIQRNVRLWRLRRFAERLTDSVTLLQVSPPSSSLLFFADIIVNPFLSQALWRRKVATKRFLLMKKLQEEENARKLKEEQKRKKQEERKRKEEEEQRRRQENKERKRKAREERMRKEEEEREENRRKQEEEARKNKEEEERQRAERKAKRKARKALEEQKRKEEEEERKKGEEKEKEKRRQARERQLELEKLEEEKRRKEKEREKEEREREEKEFRLNTEKELERR